MYSRFAAGKKTRTEMATEKPNLPASEEQISPAAEDVIAACEATDGVADPEMPAAAEPLSRRPPAQNPGRMPPGRPLPEIP